MTYETIKYSVDENIATVCLNRPKRYNSFTDLMHADMRAALKKIENNNDLRCLIITGAGKAFCTGQDLNDRYKSVKSSPPNLGKSLEKNYNRLIQKITNLKIPVICAVNGVTAGAGIGLALACDIVIAVKSAQFNFAFAKVGLIPDAGCSWAAVQALGLPRARAIALLGESISAQKAEEFGLIWKSVEADDLEDEVQEIARRLMGNPAIGLAFTKRAITAAAHHSLTEQLTLEAQFQTIAGRSQDYAEAVCAFVEKRKPDFKNK